MTDAALALQLVAAPEPPAPAGLALPPAAAYDLLVRLRDRLRPYARLRLALSHDEAILFAPDASETGPLPWSEAARWLAWDGALLVPCGRQLEVPPRWRAEVVRRMLDRHTLAGPAALLPGDDGGLRLLDLSGSRALADLDPRALAMLAA